MLIIDAPVSEIRAKIGAAALLAVALTGCAKTPDDVLTPARKGSIACIRPDAENKQCNTLLRYAFAKDGSIAVHADVTMSEKVVMSTTSAAEIKNGLVCSTGKIEDAAAAAFTISGAPATVDETNAIRGELVRNMQGRAPTEACFNFADAGDEFTAEATVNGVRRAELDEPMIWVAAKDGYVARP